MPEQNLNTNRRAFIKIAGLGIAGLSLPFHLDAFSPKEGNTYLLYIGTYTDGDSEGIYLYKLDVTTGELVPVSTTSDIENPSYLAFDPKKRFLYAVAEVTDLNGKSTGAVNAYSVDQKSGALTFLNSQITEGGAPCYVHVDKSGKTVLVANYVGGNVASFPINENGHLGAASDVFVHKPAGKNDEKQQSHAHCFVTDPQNNFALAADLGLDQIFVYKLDENGRLAPNEPHRISTKSGAGPRHLTFHPNGKYVYVINELNSTMSAFSYDKDAGILTELQTISTLPSDFKGESNCADVHVSPNGKFLYGSNRGHNSIVVYKIDQNTGKLNLVQHVSTQGNWPRNFTIDPSGRMLLVANQRSNDIFTYKIDSKSGKLKATGKQANVPSPVCLTLSSSSS